MTQIAECSDPRTRENPSIRTVLETRTALPDSYGVVRVWTLYHRSAGWVLAGSCCRMQEREVWGAQFERDGATHGRQFLTEAEAAAYFTERVMGK